jgi:hypothetical protein
MNIQENGLIRNFEIPPQKIIIPERVIAARMGFKGVGKIPESFKDTYKKIYETAMKLSTPSAAVKTYDVLSCDGEGIEISGLRINGKLALSQLGESVQVSAMLVTLGSEIDEEVSRLHEKGKELESFMLDSIGSELVEFTARYVDGILREEKDLEGLKGSARISPGYVDLDLSLNAWFANEMGEELDVFCDEESFIFTPRKTISAFVGWSK